MVEDIPSKLEIQYKKGVYFSFNFGQPVSVIVKQIYYFIFISSLFKFV